MERVYHRFALTSLFWVSLLCVPAPTFAQAPSTDGISCNLGASVGARRYRPGAWGLVEFRAANQTDAMVEVQAVLRFIDDPTVQYSRRVTVPPHSVLRSTCPILVPDCIPASKRNVEFLTEQILPPIGTDPEKKQTPQEAISGAQPVLLDVENPTVGMIADEQRIRPPDFEHPFHTGSPPPWPEPDYPIYDMIIAAKRARNLSRRISSFEMEDLPPDPACLDVLDVLVLSSDRLASDPAGIAIVRDWVLAGGNLWIMLHDVQSETVSAVMGDTFDCAVVDRVELNSVTIHNAVLGSDAAEDEHMEFEEPVRFVRVIPDGVTTTYTVNGWPAAFWQPFGVGRVYFTTIGPNAWMRPTTPRDPPPRSRDNATPFFPRNSLNALACDCLAPRRDSQLDAESLKPFLSQQIGYRILGRGTVLAILSGFCFVLVCAGWRLFHIGHSERLLWAAPLTAVAFGLVFLALGTVSKRSVPPTVATITRIVLERGVGVGHSSGLIALYNQDANSELLGAKRGGVFFPDMTALGGRNRRITWTDEGVWNWERLELPAGVRTAPFQRPLVLDAALDCRAKFGPDGLQGDIGPLPLPGLEDAVIAIPHQNVMVASIGADGSIHSGPRDVLAPGEFMAESLPSSEQVRRKSVYDKLLGARPVIGALPRPMLYAWADPLDMGFIFPQPNRRDSTILSIPLRLERTPAGTKVCIPAPFIPYRAIVGPDGRPPVAYTNLMHDWIESKLSTTEWLRFQMPRSVLPLKLSQASFSITVRAPSRSLEILAPVDNELVVVTKLTHPIGTYHYAFDRPAQLQLDEGGGLRMAIRVSEDEGADLDGQMAQAAWEIEQLQVEVTGTVQGE